MKLLAIAADRSADLAALHARAFAAPWDAKAFADLLAGPGVFALAAEGEAGLRGLILMRAAAGEAEVLTLAVAPEARRAGVGLALLQAGLGLAAGAGAERAFLEAAAENAPALALYARAGFEAAGRRRGYYAREGASAADALILARTLRAADA